MSQFFFRNFENKSYIENELLYHRIKTRAHNAFILPFLSAFLSVPISHARVYCKTLSICMCASFTFGFEGGMWDLIEQVLVPDHCLYFYFESIEL